MSHALALAASKTKTKTRAELLALVASPVYKDGLTKQCYENDCNIEKIMAKFAKTDTISHVAKYQGVYADYSDYNFAEATHMLTQGREIFDALPGEVRREFNQNPAAFFNHVNDPKNAEKPNFGLAALARPGNQLPSAASPDADVSAAQAAQNLPTEASTETAPPEASEAG